jgi:hypothetical protein
MKRKLVVTDVSGQPLGPILGVKQSKVRENGNDKLYRNLGN